MTISLILAESALEMVPQSLYGHPAVASHARRAGKNPSDVLLDNSWHYAAMRGIKNAEKRGRPDLVHLAVISATSTPLYKRDHALDVYIHTADDHTIHISPDVRVPKSYHRFTGLVEALYRKDVVCAPAAAGKTFGTSESGSSGPQNAPGHDNGGKKSRLQGSMERQRVLLKLRRGQTFARLLDEKGFSKVIGLSSAGTVLDSLHPYEAVARRITGNTAIVVGGFQKGHFSDAIAEHLDDVYSVGRYPLEAHVVVSRLLYECECNLLQGRQKHAA